MTRLLGWTKTFEKCRAVRLENEYVEMCVDVTQADDGFYIPVACHPSGDFPIIENTLSFTEAKQVAINWMRKHPKGFIPQQYR